MDDGTEADDGDTDDSEEYDLAESIRSFRRAGARVIEGIDHLYHGANDWIADQHVLVQSGITAGLWFAGNWVYNRIARPIIGSMVRVVSSVPTESMLALVESLLSGDLVLTTAQLLGIATGAMLGHNQLQTRKLKRIENNVIAMTDGGKIATDGGRRESENIGGGVGLGCVLAGASIGYSFGPGGVLAGIYLGYVIGLRLARREFANSQVTDQSR